MEASVCIERSRSPETVGVCAVENFRHAKGFETGNSVSRWLRRNSLISFDNRGSRFAQQLSFVLMIQSDLIEPAKGGLSDSRVSIEEDSSAPRVDFILLYITLHWRLLHPFKGLTIELLNSPVPLLLCILIFQCFQEKKLCRLANDVIEAANLCKLQRRRRAQIGFVLEAQWVPCYKQTNTGVTT